jgi:hypothetical protein
MKIRVKNSGIVKLKFFEDFPDGNLFIAEARKNIPFKIKRVYFINGFANKKAVRGKHAHKKLNQVIFCLNGSFDLNLDDGKRKQKIRLKDPSVGIILKPMLWHTMSGFSKDCVILVLADEWYKESDYIRDYQKFKKMLR